MMDNVRKNAAISFNSNGRDFSNDLSSIADKSIIETLTVSMYVPTKLSNHMFTNFSNLLNLDLSKNVFYNFENNVFDSLINLSSINLSNNLISEIGDNLFAMNKKLTEINISNNLLLSINTFAFSNLELLSVLNCNNNFITELLPYCLQCANLTDLYINNNAIETIYSMAFDYIPNLTRLELNDNKITFLTNTIFTKVIKLQYLSVNNNVIDALDPFVFFNLKELRSLSLRNNLLKNIVDHAFLYNTNLIGLDLFDNDIPHTAMTTFDSCANLKSMHLTSLNYFQIGCIINLKCLETFELCLKSSRKIQISNHFLDYFRDKTNLVTLKLTFDKVEICDQMKFTTLTNLESLHIECKEPNDTIFSEISVSKQLNRLPKLEQLTLKKLNYFTVSGCTAKKFFDTKNLKSFNLTGVKNRVITDIFQNFMKIEYLNLSFSNIKYISEYALKNLHNLEHLNLEHSKLNVIRTLLFKFNLKLKVINCFNCCIETIESYAFRNLSNLESLDLRSNILNKVSNKAFFGISPKAQVYLNETGNK